MSAMFELVPGVPFRRITRREYYILAEAGAFAEGERVELLDGVISPMDPKRGRDCRTVMRMTMLLVNALHSQANVVVHSPFAASDISEPEPDLYITSLELDEDDHPSTAYCVMEVAVTSQLRDRRKVAIYAAANVPQYIIIDVPARSARIYREPSGTQYDREETAREGTPIVIDAFPDVSFDLAAVLPKSAS